MPVKKLPTKLLPVLVRDRFDLQKTLYSLNPEGMYNYGQKMFCPFHHNENTPAAVLYKGTEDSYDSIYCFAEQQQYTVVDILQKLMGYNIYEVGYAIWNEMTDYEKDLFLSKHNKPDLISAFSEPKETQKDIDKKQIFASYKEGKIKLNDLLGKLV